MAVVIETTLGDLTVDLFIEQRPRTCLNFLKLCKMKYYNFNLFHTIQNGFIAQTGDPTGNGSGGDSIWGVLEGADKRYFSGEKLPKIRHTDPGLLSMVAVDDTMIGSQFFFTLGTNLNSLDSQHCVIGEVVEGQEVLRKLNETICDESNQPYQDVRITHTVVLDDPFDDPRGFRAPSRSPSPSVERLVGGRLAPDEEIDETKGKSAEEIAEMIQEKEAKARATILEIVGDLPDADMAPPENVLFVCKLNPVTTDEDLEIIFSRFGKIMNCEVIRDKKSGDSLQYAFIEFEDQKSCENAYFKMDNVLIDDRRIHVDFSQSVSKIKWQGKGRGVIHMDDNSRHLDKKREQTNKGHNSRYERKTQMQSRAKQPDMRSSSNTQRRSTRSRSRDRRVDRSKQEKEKSRRNNDNHPRNNGPKDRYRNNDGDESLHSHRDKDRHDHRNPSIQRSRNHENKYDKQIESDKNPEGKMKEFRENEDIRKNKTEGRRSRSPHIKKESKDNRHERSHSTNHDESKQTRISNGENSGRATSRRRNRSASRSDTPPPELEEKSKKRNLEKKTPESDDISPRKKIEKKKVLKKKSSTSRRKKKQSTSSESSSTDSSQSSSTSTSDSSSSESDRKKKKISKKRQIKKKKKQQSSSSSSDSSTDSSSSSSDSSSSSSSESDCEPVKKKSKKKNARISKKVSSKKRKS